MRLYMPALAGTLKAKYQLSSVYKHSYNKDSTFIKKEG